MARLRSSCLDAVFVDGSGHAGVPLHPGAKYVPFTIPRKSTGHNDTCSRRMMVMCCVCSPYHPGGALLSGHHQARRYRGMHSSVLPQDTLFTPRL
jgi:hypothetical protein